MIDREMFELHAVDKDRYRGVLKGPKADTERVLLRRIPATKAVVDGLPYQISRPREEGMPAGFAAVCGTKQRRHWFTTMPCFGIDVGSTSKTYFIYKRVGQGGPIRYVALGDAAHLEPEVAIKKARAAIVQLENGIDPKVTREIHKKTRLVSSITLRHAFEAYLRTNTTIKPSTASRYLASFECKVPDWLDQPLVSLNFERTRNAFGAWIKVKDGERVPGYSYAAQTLQHLSIIWRFAERHWPETFPRNPFRDVRDALMVKACKPRSNYIEPARLSQFFRALQQVEMDADLLMQNRQVRSGGKAAFQHRKAFEAVKVGCDYLAFLVGTGLRRSEASNLRWDAVNENDGTLHIHETKNGKPLVLPICGFHHQILERRRSYALMRKSSYVFPSMGTKNVDGPYTEPRDVIAAVSARMADFKFCAHDLRRTFVSLGHWLGIDSVVLKRLVNHSDGGDVTLSHYLKTGDEVKRVAMQKISDELQKQKASGQGMRIADVG